jgi:hypothetical protein
LFLFGSSYTPLFAIFLIRNFEPKIGRFTQSIGDLFQGIYYSFQAPFFSLILIAVILSSNITLWLLLRESKKIGSKSYTVSKSKEKTSDALNYIVTYIIPFFSFNSSKLVDLISLSILLLVIAFVYINSNLIYINPMLSFMGYRIYEVEVNMQLVIVIITSKIRLKKNSQVNLVELTEDIYLEV